MQPPAAGCCCIHWLLCQTTMITIHCFRYYKELSLNPEVHHASRALVGSISYLALYKRPNLILYIRISSQSSCNLLATHLYFERPFRYIKRNRLLRNFVQAHYQHYSWPHASAVDADWGGCSATQRLTSEYISAISGLPAIWKHKLQNVVVLSSGEAEYVALSACVKDITWLRRTVLELIQETVCENEFFISPRAIEIDKTLVMSIASIKHSTRLTKHITLRFHFICESLSSGCISLQKVSISH